MKTLLAMRHAQAGFPSHVNSDYERPLTDRGTRDLARAAALLQRRNTVPERALASSAMRAQQTAAGVCEHLGMCDDTIDFAEALYLAPPDTLIEHIQHTPDGVNTLLVVAHNPGMEELIHLLTNATVALPPAGLATIRFDTPQWAAICPARGQLAHFFTPDMDTT